MGNREENTTYKFGMANLSKDAAHVSIFQRFTTAGIANRSWHDFLLIQDRASGP